MPIDQMEFTELEKQISKRAKPALQLLGPGLGKVRVVALSRDNCPACKRQKPKLDKLAKDMAEKHGDKVGFVRIHVKQPSGDVTESLRAKDVFGHYFYPTNLILLRTKDRGAVEYYRSSSPRMSELRRNTEIALEITATLAKETS